MQFVILTLLSKLKDFSMSQASHTDWKTGNISETVLDRDVVTAGL